MLKNKPKIKITKNGPYMVSGNVPIAEQIIIAGEEGISVKWQEGKKFPEKTVAENFESSRVFL